MKDANRIMHNVAILFLAQLCSCVFTAQAAVSRYSEKEQYANLARAELECAKKIEEANRQQEADDSVLSCPINFGGGTCWPKVPANSTAVIQCPGHINLFDTSGKAYRYCMSNGTWYFDSATSYSIIDYRNCSQQAEDEDSDRYDRLVHTHLRRLGLVYLVGCSVSVFSLLVALVVMFFLRRLHCPRNAIHMNMFVSFILKDIVQLLVYYTSDQPDTVIGQQHDPNQLDDTNFPDLLDREGVGKLSVLCNSSVNWQCKLLATIWMYTRLSNHVWVFVEGFYLLTLIFINTFSDKSSIRWFLLLGWGSSLLFVIPWMFVRIYLDDYECWMVYYNINYRWIIEVPIAILIVVNFTFFLIIIRLLFTKLRASASSTRESRVYRKLAKSTLILIPLFGVHYIVFLFAEFSEPAQKLEVVRFYFDALISSFQGLMVSFLFCFMNGEVRAEIIKKWKRWRTVRTFHLQSSATVSHHLTVSHSIGSDNDSLTLHRVPSRNASIQSANSNNGPMSTLIEESQILLSTDKNQNEVETKENMNGSHS
ncbi:secretin receptor-like isoform X2 [Watersipora subatra]|uniref:secretin receptor-like isoform X2 n=1 Tax=Watersipora subatra TaxID=2589382 RepID=UPI00355B1A32